MERSIALSAEQRQALADADGRPIYIVDPTSGDKVVMVRTEAFQALMNARGIDETYSAVNDAFARIWDGPQLDDFNDGRP